MTKKERDAFKKELIELEYDHGIEAAHRKADYILCAVLSKLGYDDIVEEYHNLEKWYA